MGFHSFQSIKHIGYYSIFTISPTVISLCFSVAGMTIN